QSPSPTISDIICTFKSLTTKLSNANDNITGRKIWQRSFHDHIIRNENEYQKIWEYINANPLKWEDDCFYT
ncbi:MAG: transposase, partial [Oscillospiraceae bacterium]